MRPTFCIIAATALALASRAHAQSSMPIRDTTLANGLHVIVMENHSVPLVTVEFNVKNGGYTQTPEYAGLAHLYEHMFFKANRTISSQEQYLQRLRQLGASWNGTPSEERVNYFITVGIDSMRPAMQFMEDAIRYPLFDQNELIRERPVVIGEFDRNEANPFFHLGRGMDTLLWTPAYYSHKNVIGDRAIILGTPQDKMREIQKRYYVPNNSALLLAGDVTPANGFRMAAEVLGDWPRGPDPFATPVADPPPLTRTQAVVVTQPVNSVTLMFEFQGPSVGSDPTSTYAADVLTAVLRKPTSGFQKRLVDSGVAFTADISYYTLNHVGPISLVLQTTPEKIQRARQAALDEIASMADSNYISPQELADAEKELGIAAQYEREEVTNWAHTVGFWWAVADLGYYRNYVPNMQRVSRGDIARYAQKYIAGKPYVVGALLSEDAKKKSGLTPESLLPKAAVP